jgi:hypothetical protein
MSSEFPEENDPRYREEVSLGYFVNFCAGLAEVTKRGLKLNNIDSKLYYKLRHNLLKTVCLNALDIITDKEKPFSDYEDLGVDSKKTPDLLIPLLGSYLLIEFTISTSLKNILTNKGYFSKYTS